MLQSATRMRATAAPLRVVPQARVQLRRVPPPLTDRELAEALLAQKPWAPRLAWSRFSPMVQRILTRALGAAEVEDRVQEVFLGLFQAVRDLRDPGALRSFIIVIAVRSVRAERRRRRGRSGLGPSAYPDSTDALVSAVDVDAEHALRRLQGVLERLRVEDRRAFVLRFVEGLSAEEVATTTDVSVATARRRCVRAVARVRFFAERDPFLRDYTRKLPSGTENDGDKL